MKPRTIPIRAGETEVGANINQIKIMDRQPAPNEKRAAHLKSLIGRKHTVAPRTKPKIVTSQPVWTPVSGGMRYGAMRLIAVTPKITIPTGNPKYAMNFIHSFISSEKTVESLSTNHNMENIPPRTKKTHVNLENSKRKSACIPMIPHV